MIKKTPLYAKRNIEVQSETPVNHILVYRTKGKWDTTSGRKIQEICSFSGDIKTRLITLRNLSW